MKKIYYFLIFVTGITNAQIVNIPDANFKAALLAAATTNEIASLDPNTLDNGPFIKIDTNNNGEIEVSEALTVISLNLTGLNISDITGIEYFTNLVHLNCSDNVFTNLTISNLHNLKWFEFGSNHVMSSLNITGCEELRTVRCPSSNLTSLTITPDCQKFALLYCGGNLLTSLDFSAFPLFGAIYADNNDLHYLNLKNGCYCSGVMYFFDNPNLKYVCADEDEIPALLSLMQSSAWASMSVNVNTYCSFSPGGNYNIVTGTQLFDADNNGCDAADPAPVFVKMKINDGTNDGATFTNATGNYKFYTQAGNFTVTPAVENPGFFNVNPANAVVNFPVVDNSVSTQDFCLSANGVHQDMEIVLAPIVPARPGFDAVYKIIYKNNGNQTISQNLGIGLTYDANHMSFVSANPVVAAQNTGTANWNYINLMPFESRSITVTLHVNAPTDAVNPVNIGDILHFIAVVLPQGSDENSANNTFVFDQKVVGSFDPNAIKCIEGDTVASAEIGKYLHYIINFENTGTASAQNIVVKDIIDTTKFEVESIQILGSSHSVDANITGNVLEMIFKNIYLESGGHGNILLKIKSKATLVEGDSVANGGAIFFDYNFPVSTNVATTLFGDQTLGIADNDLDDSILAYPNPTSDIINIKAGTIIKSATLYDVQGRLLQTNMANEKTIRIDISEKASGTYFLKIISDKGIKIQKIIKK